MTETVEQLEESIALCEKKIKEITAELPDLEGNAYTERYNTLQSFKKSLKEAETQLRTLSKL